MLSEENRIIALRVLAILCAVAALAFALSALLKAVVVAVLAALAALLWMKSARIRLTGEPARHSGAEHFPN